MCRQIVGQARDSGESANEKRNDTKLTQAGCPTQACFAWVGVLTFVDARTRGVIQNSRSLSNQDKILAQAKPAWTGHPHLSSITGILGRATRPCVPPSRHKQARRVGHPN